MLVVKVYVWPFGHREAEREIGRAYIWNIGGTVLHGDYGVAVMNDPKLDYDSSDKLASGTLVGFPRGPRNLWPLVRHALNKVRPILRQRPPRPISHASTEAEPLS